MNYLAGFGYFYVYISPFIYLSYHGWASMRLIDTELTDKIAFRFWLVTVIFALIVELTFASKAYDCAQTGKPAQPASSASRPSTP